MQKIVYVYLHDRLLASPEQPFQSLQLPAIYGKLSNDRWLIFQKTAMATAAAAGILQWEEKKLAFWMVAGSEKSKQYKVPFANY